MILFYLFLLLLIYILFYFHLFWFYFRCLNKHILSIVTSYLDLNKDTILVCKYWKIIITEQRKNLASNPETKNPLKKNFKEINRETVKQLKKNSVNNDGNVISMTELISQNNYGNLLYGEKKFMKKIPEKSPRHLLKNNAIKNDKENETTKRVQFLNKIVVGERENENESDDKMSFKNIGNLTELIIDDNTEMNNHHNNIGSVSVDKYKYKNTFSGENEEQIILNSIIKNREFDSSDFTKCDEKTEKTNSAFSSESSKNSPIKFKNNIENSNKNDDKNGFEITGGENKEQNKNKDENDVTENNNNDNDNTDYHNNNENENEYDDNNDNDDDDDDDENGNFDHLLMHVKEIRSESQLTDLIEFIQNRYISIEQTDNEKKKLKRIIKGKKRILFFLI